MAVSSDQNLRNFNTFITQLEGGALNDELTEKMQLCVQEIADACMDRGGVHQASITLKLDFKMDHKDRVVEITAALSEKLPKAPRGRGGIFFCDDQGNLTRQNPKQISFDDELERQRSRRSGEAS